MGELPNQLTSRDKQQQQDLGVRLQDGLYSRLYKHSLSLFPPNPNHYQMGHHKPKDVNWVLRRNQELEQINSLLPHVEKLASKAKSLLLPLAINTSGTEVKINHPIQMTLRRQQLLKQEDPKVKIASRT